LERVRPSMPDIKGYHLYVNLGASQVRKRLKGVGLQVPLPLCRLLRAAADLEDCPMK
jgi:hypothetical protein